MCADVQFDLITGQLRDDPDNIALQALQEELSTFVDLLEENIRELQPKQQPKPIPKEPSPPKEPEKWSRENHPAFKKAAATPPPPPPEEKDEAPPNYQVNDTIMAKWVSGDKGFYPARITSITGSSTAPILTVKFKSYDNTETLRLRDVKPMSNKRKADGAPSSTVPAPTQPTGPGVVSSATATVYPDALREAESGADPAKPPKPKKIKAKKELEAGKSKWQEFNKSKSGKGKKDSMFRTPDGVHARGMLTIMP